MTGLCYRINSLFAILTLSLKMSGEVADLKCARGAAKGQITRKLASLLTLSSKGLAEQPLERIQRHSDVIDKADITYYETHSKLEDLATDAPARDQLAKDEEEHQKSMQKVEEVLSPMMARASAWIGGRCLMLSLEDLEGDLVEGYSPAHASQFVAIEAAMQRFRDMMSLTETEENLKLKNLREKVMPKWRGANKLRIEAGYSSDPLLVGSTRASESVAQGGKVKVKLPTFDGVTAHYQDFKELFLDIVKGQTHLGEPAKKSLLIDAMATADAKAKAISVGKGKVSFNSAMEKFSMFYENTREVVSLHLNQLLQVPTAGANKPEIEHLISTIEDGISGLELARSFTIEQVLAAYMEGKLSAELWREWRQRMTGCTEAPKIAQFLVFLREQLHIVAGETVSASVPGKPQSPRKKRWTATRDNTESEQAETVKGKEKVVFRAAKNKSCVMCEGAHTIYACPEFKENTPVQRHEIARQRRLCFNCLAPGHRTDTCKCETRCQECKKPHHTLIHGFWLTKAAESSDSEDVVVQQVTAMGSQASLSTTALATMSAGTCIRSGRILIDMGAEVHLVSKEFAQSICAKPIPNSAQNFRGVGQGRSEYAIRLLLHGDDCVGQQDTRVSIVAHVMENICQPTANRAVSEFQDLECIQSLPLAYPEYKPGSRVDVILGNDAWYACRLGNVAGDPKLSVFADETIFGWVLGGPRLKLDLSESCSPRVYVVRLDEEEEEKLSTLMER